MKKIRLNILVIAIVCSIPLILASNYTGLQSENLGRYRQVAEAQADTLDTDENIFDKNAAYCYRFRWVETVDSSRPEKQNCTGDKNVPCIEPLHTGAINITELWVSKNMTSLCPQTTGQVCLKHTATFNNEIVTSSFFCGKVIEDKTTVITSGCYDSTKDGYTYRVCACQSGNGKEPCNASISISHSNFILLIIFFVYAYIY